MFLFFFSLIHSRFHKGQVFYHEFLTELIWSIWTNHEMPEKLPWKILLETQNYKTVFSTNIVTFRHYVQVHTKTQNIWVSKILVKWFYYDFFKCQTEGHRKLSVYIEKMRWFKTSWWKSKTNLIWSGRVWLTLRSLQRKNRTAPNNDPFPEPEATRILQTCKKRFLHTYSK